MGAKKEHDNFRLKVLLKELKENRSESVTNMTFQEIVMNARFVSPVLLSKQPIQNGDGTATFTEDTTIRMPMLTSADGKGFYAMFTDKEEFAKWESVKGTDTVLLAFDDFAALIEKNEEAAGVVLNPFSDNLVLNRVTVEHLKTQKDLRTKGVARHKVTKDTKVMIGDPKEYPTELIEAVKRYLPGVPEVRKAWIRLMMKNNTPSLLMVVDQTGEKERIFRGIAEVARPYLKKMYIDMVAYCDEFGKKAVEGAEPFYER